MADVSDRLISRRALGHGDLGQAVAFASETRRRRVRTNHSCNSLCELAANVHCTLLTLPMLVYAGHVPLALEVGKIALRVTEPPDHVDLDIEDETLGGRQADVRQWLVYWTTAPAVLQSL